MNRRQRRDMKYRPGLIADRSVPIPVHRRTLAAVMARQIRVNAAKYEETQNDRHPET